MLAEEIESGALKLSVVNRIRLVETLLDSLDKTDAEIEAIWVKESENRYQAYKDGCLKGVPLAQLQAEMEK